MIKSKKTSQLLNQLNSFNYSFFIFIIIGLFTRFYNLPTRLYFLWDNGRDAWAIHRIAQGDLALIGHTSGIQGFFLGPAWFYLGTLGHLLGNGSPWIMSYWYITVTALSLPLFWILSHQLFQDKKLAKLTAFLLLLAPASLRWSSFVWNPMITIPLIAGAYYCLLQARRSRHFLIFSFFLLALSLQFEFAYAVFLVFPLYLLIFWLRGKFNWRDYLYSGLAIGITLTPQLLFELRNKFIMTQSLFQALGDKSKSIPYLQLWQTRPLQLFETTKVQLFGHTTLTKLSMLLIIFVFGSGLSLILTNKLKKKEKFAWQLSYLLVLLPYSLFLLWRGNEGNFFDYYLTPHFVLLIPTIVLTLQYMINKEKWLVFKKISIAKLIALFLLLSFSWGSLVEIKNTILFVDNQAGIKVMSQAVTQLYTWSDEDGQTQPIFRIFTPNRETEHYDYLSFWQAKRQARPVPLTQRAGTEAYWYILIEPDHEFPPEVRFDPWYKEATKNGELLRKQKVGVLELETWKLNK